MTVKATVHHSFLVLAALIFMASGYENSPLKRQVNIPDFEGKAENALDLISERGNFYFSYNPSLVNVQHHVELSGGQYQVEQLLSTVFDDNVEYNVAGRHVILLPTKKVEKKKKQAPKTASKPPSKYIIKGTVTNAETGEIITEATVYESNKLMSTLTDNSGHYSLIVTADDAIPLAISKASFYDTVIVVEPAKADDMEISLRPMAPATTEMPDVDLKLKSAKGEVNDIRLVQFMVPEQQMAQSNNLEYQVQRPAQISFLPFLGSNHTMSGSAVNHLSLNILGGYSAGTEGIELGGFINVNRIKMKGLQAAGFGNITGGRVQGVQLAGFFNHNRGSTKGLQAAGFHNMTYDTMAGAQLAGFVNILKGRMEGLQAAGFANLTSQDVSGVQLAGFANTSGGDVLLSQASGFANYAKNVGGGQFAGFCNVADGDVQGIQAAGFLNQANGSIGGIQSAGFANMAKDVGVVQAAGFANVATGEITGLQTSGFLNVAQYLNGVQLGIFNFSDTVSERALPIGFLSFANHGYHAFSATANGFGLYMSQLHTGVNRFYNIFGFGLGQYGSKFTYGIQYGIGNRKMWNNWLGRNWELTSTQIHQPEVSWAGVNIVNSFEFKLEMQPFKFMQIVLGPALRAQVYDTNAQVEAVRVAPYSWRGSKYGSTQVDYWVGGNAGVKFSF